MKKSRVRLEVGAVIGYAPNIKRYMTGAGGPAHSAALIKIDKPSQPENYDNSILNYNEWP